MSSPYTSYNGYPPYFMAPPMWPPQSPSMPPTVPVDLDTLNKTQRKQLRKSIQFYRELEKALEEKAKSKDKKPEEPKITTAVWLKIALFLTMCWPFVAVAQLALAVVAIRSLLH